MFVPTKTTPAGLPAGLSIVQGAEKARVPRRPRHGFQILQRPYELTPFFIAPVLAGETMKNLLFQARAVSDTLNNRLLGAHLEHYYFYVKLRDLADREDIEDMILGSGTSVNTSSGDAYHFVQSGAKSWFEMCTTSVLKHFFRDEGDTGSHVGGTTGLPLVMWDNKNSVMESLIDDAALVTDSIPDAAEPYPEHEQAYNAWMFARQMQLTELDFEDYLGSFGVRMAPGEELNKPELVRFTKNWSYPANTVDGDGAINTQFSWSVTERADKDRFFKEPGFLVGYTVFRPKVYVGGRNQSAVSLLNGPLSWLPATMKEQAHSSLQQIAGSSADLPWAAASEPTGGQLDSDETYWIDVRDLFVYGDFFTNRTLDANSGNVPPEDITDFHGKKYPDDTALQALGASGLTVESDGIVSLNILGTQMDMT